MIPTIENPEVIDVSTGSETVTHRYNMNRDAFVGYLPTHIVTVDAGLTSQEVDVILDREIFGK